MSDVVSRTRETEISDPLVLASIPVVSVWMITFNHGLYLADAIEGVIKQRTDFPVELIIGEDCSTDNTLAIALDYQRRYPQIIRVVHSDSNIGAMKNDARVFNKVRGEFVAYCEGDDYWHDSLKLQKQVDFLRENPDVGLVHSDYDLLVYTFGTWRRIKYWNRKKHGAIPQGDIYSDLLNFKFICTCTMMGRTYLLHQHYHSKLRSNTNPVGDWPLVLHMSKLGNIGYIDRSLATYRRIPGSVMNSGWNQSVDMQKKLLKMLQNVTDEFGADSLEYMQIRYSRILKFSLRAKSKVDFDLALKWLQCNSPSYANSLKVVVWKSLIRTGWLLDWYVYVTSVLYEVSLLINLIKRKSGNAVS